MSEPRTSDRNVDRVIRSWLHEDRHEDISRVAGAVLDLLDTTPQRRHPWWPARRIPFMNKPVSLGLGAAAVVAALVIGVRVLGAPAPGDVGSTPSALSSLTPAPTATTEPSASPPASPPPLTQSFTSTVHGISVSYPDGWIAQAATEPWTDCLYCTLSLSNPQIDVLHRPPDDDSLMLRIASQPIGESTPEDWVAAQMASWDRCTTTERIVIDGATGLSGGETCDVAVVTTAGRGYHIDLWMSPDDRDRFAQYDRAWFEEVLATVQLHPEDAVDSTPSPSRSTSLTTGELP
jgi:hypothetical protein